MELHLEVEQHDGRRSLLCAGDPDEAVSVIVQRAIVLSDLRGDAIVEFLEQDENLVRAGILARDLPHPRVKTRLSCVEVHFEGETRQHSFPVRAPWSRVHQWACHEFEVSHVECANLELREGAADGPVINEARPIGRHSACVQVWVVKPGPEPFGGSAR